MAKVGIVLGSDSDLPVMSGCFQALEEFGLSFEILISSAHRLPEETAAFAKNAAKRGLKVIVAGAGWAHHLAGLIAAFTPLPVIAVPLSSSPLKGLDALYSAVQMPKGVPVATVAIDGAYNAGILAAQIIGAGDPLLREKIQYYKQELARQVKAKNLELQKLGYKAYLQGKK